MDDGCDVMEPGVSPDTLPTSYINNTADVEETNSDPQPEDVVIDPLLNPLVETSPVVTNDDDKCGTEQEWLEAVKREVPMKDDGDEDVGTSSFENISPLSDDMQGSTKGFRKVLGILSKNQRL